MSPLRNIRRAHVTVLRNTNSYRGAQIFRFAGCRNPGARQRRRFPIRTLAEACFGPASVTVYFNLHAEDSGGTWSACLSKAQGWKIRKPLTVWTIVSTVFLAAALPALVGTYRMSLAARTGSWALSLITFSMSIYVSVRDPSGVV